MQLLKQETYQKCIDECFGCMECCDMCVSACLKSPNIKAMTHCMQMCMDCADMCMVAGRMMARNSDCAKMVCSMCAKMCDMCAAECSKFDMNECKMCAEMCKSCADECKKMCM